MKKTANESQIEGRIINISSVMHRIGVHKEGIRFEKINDEKSYVIVSPSERERGGSSKVAEAVENDIPVVTEAWLIDIIKNEKSLPLDNYDVLSDLAVEGRGIPWDKQDSENEAIESLFAEVKIYENRGVYKDSKLEERGGEILHKDGILYNCVFSLSDNGGELNEYSVMQYHVDPCCASLYLQMQDSPVFKYLNSLSPIKPVKSINITQTFNSLTFSSPPSVFTSPHVSSLRDSRFLRRHQFSDPSKPDFSSSHVDKIGKSEEASDIVDDVEQQRNFDQGRLVAESSAVPDYETSAASELPQSLSYDCVSPDVGGTSNCGMEAKCVPELAGSSTELVPYAQIGDGKESIGIEVHQEGPSHIDENKEAAGCDWENLFSDDGDLLLFDTPNDSKSLIDVSQRSLQHGMNFCSSVTDNLQISGAVNADNNISSHLEYGHGIEIVKDQDILVSYSKSVAGDSEKVDNEIASNLQRGTRRRCLVFEMVGSHRKLLDDGSTCSSSMLLQSHENTASSDKCVLPLKPESRTPRRRLPGIGLHLNTLAAKSVDQKAIINEASTPGGQPISLSGSAAYFNLSNSQQISSSGLVVTSSGKDICSVDDGTTIAEDASQETEYMVNEGLNHSSPKRKRRRSDSDGETDCKRCNCKKSKCLKLYCECFAAGVYCVEPCSCQECFNKPIYEDTVLATRKQIESRNPLAFAPKVIKKSDSVIEIGEESSKTPASARHKRGCNCKKSGCLKKYCECYQGGVGCSINCRCEGCKNAFGRKDGTEVELEEEVAAKTVVDRSLQITTVQNDAEQNTSFALPTTPSQFGSQSIQPISKSKKPPRSSFLSIGGTSSALYGTPRFGKLNPLQPIGKMKNDGKDEMPEILQSNTSPNSGVKSLSPNSKRVSPPHCNIGSSPGQRSSRKLILQSIPSFPSLTPKH